MDVSRVGQIQGAAPQATDRVKTAQKPKAAPTDRVEISPLAKNTPESDTATFVNLARAALDIRQDKVEEVKTKMAQGVYEKREATVKAAEAVINEVIG